MIKHIKTQTSSLRENLTKYDYDPGYFAKNFKDQIVRKFIIDNNIKSVLDLGADTCYVHALLKNSLWDGSYTAMDYRNSANLDFLQNGEFIVTQSMISTLNDLDETYEIILLLDIIEHMKDKSEGIQLIHAAINKLSLNGYLIITTPNSKDGNFINWPKYHEYEYNYKEILECGINSKCDLMHFIGWSANNEALLENDHYNSIIPIEFSRVFWAYNNPTLSRDVMYIYKKNNI